MKNIVIVVIVVFIAIYFWPMQKTKLQLSEPQVRIIDKFLSIDECNNIIKSCSKFNRSGTTTGKIHSINSSRTSETTVIKIGENKDIDNLRNKVSTVLNIDPAYMESIQITKYSKGQEYKYHYDYFKDKVKNQRKDTILIYLNTLNVEDGGNTHFYYGKSFQPRAGTLLTWSNTDDYGNKNRNTLHAGKPVLTDNTKYVITIWTRHNKLH